MHGGVGDEEVRKPRIGQRPILLTKAEVMEHFPLHLQSRIWCRHCRAGKGRLAPHIVEPSDRERLGITVSADYALMGSEEAEEEMQPSLLMSDDHKGALWVAGVRVTAPRQHNGLEDYCLRT